MPHYPYPRPAISSTRVEFVLWRPARGGARGGSHRCLRTHPKIAIRTAVNASRRDASFVLVSEVERSTAHCNSIDSLATARAGCFPALGVKSITEITAPVPSHCSLFCMVKYGSDITLHALRCLVQTTNNHHRIRTAPHTKWVMNHSTILRR
jgi:hypothetical protein